MDIYRPKLGMKVKYKKGKGTRTGRIVDFEKVTVRYLDAPVFCSRLREKLETLKSGTLSLGSKVRFNVGMATLIGQIMSAESVVIQEDRTDARLNRDVSLIEEY